MGEDFITISFLPHFLPLRKCLALKTIDLLFISCTDLKVRLCETSTRARQSALICSNPKRSVVAGRDRPEAVISERLFSTVIRAGYYFNTPLRNACIWPVQG